MKVICVGYPKTGTKSILKALRILGYHSHDVMDHYSLHLDDYIDLFEGRCPEGDSERLRMMYADVDAVVEVPANMLWYKLVEAFPDAKVVLMVRDSEERHGLSVHTTVQAYQDMFGFFPRYIQPWLSATRAKLWHLEDLYLNVLNPEWETALDKPASYCHYGRQHNAAVKQLVPADRLLVFNFRDGWEPLCNFLGRPVPKQEYPRMNITPKNGDIPPVVAETITVNVFGKIATETRKSLLVILSLAVGVCAGAVYLKQDFFRQYFQ